MTAVLVKLPEIDFIDDKEGKPVAINKFIGRRPVMAFGNSDGDWQMLQWTAAGSGGIFALRQDLARRMPVLDAELVAEIRRVELAGLELQDHLADEEEGGLKNGQPIARVGALHVA